MERILLLIAFTTCSLFSFGQESTTESIPRWAQLMYENNSNIAEIDRLYRDYCTTHDYQKTKHSQYYKKWRRSIDRYVNNEGYLDTELIVRLGAKMDEHRQSYNSHLSKAGNWSPIGPWNEKKGGGAISGRHSNVSSIAICASSPNVMYCGTEPGELYKSTDGGDNWFNVSYSIVTAYATQVVVANANFHGIAVHPTNPDKVYAVSANEIFISNDGGTNWTSNVFANAPLFGYIVTPHEIQIDPLNNNRLFIAGLDGLHVSTDAGLTWTQVFNDQCFDIEFQPGSPSTMYVLRDNPSTDVHEFVKSTDGGATWSVITNGWYNSTDNDRNVRGGRLAVSLANPLVVYAYLIGNSKQDDDDFIGVYKSSDGGNSWVNTLGYDGAPYTTSHPNLLASNPISGFNQGMDNCGLMVSNTNADEILVGGINLWKSTDGGVTYENLADYYYPGLFDIHVDMQDFRSNGSTYWVSTDGGIYKSTDFFSTQPEVKMNGVQGADFWGFGAGWNFDVFGGGTFHNGVDFHTEEYPQGEFFSVAAGEPASGYVSPGDTNRIFWTNNSRRLPATTNGFTSGAYGLGILPNESWWFAESSKLLFHPNCYNHIYTGNDNNLMESNDGGANFTTIFSAPNNFIVLDIEISRSNHQVMYAVARNGSGTGTTLYRTDDQWQTNSIISLPSGGGSHMLIELDAEDENTLWLCYPRGANGQKVFKSINSGQTWTNITSPELDDQRIYSMASVGGTDGGIYVNTNVTCYYRNDIMGAWAIDNLGLPLSISTKEIIPFYRDGKVRIGSYGKGVWESALFEPPSRPVAQIMANQITATCAGELIYFDDYSMLNHSGASWLWTFENGSIASSTQRNPIVSFTDYGLHLVTLTVTNASGISSTDSLFVTVLTPPTVASEDFEGPFTPYGWKLGTGSQWIKTTDAGGYGASTSSMMFDNFSINQVGTVATIETAVDLTNAVPSDCFFYFDVAYAKYASNYADSLMVSISTDCGTTWTSLYLKGGDDLATSPDVTADGFVPTNDQWRTDSIDLGAYVGYQNVIIQFGNINAYGQRLYVDNVNLSTSSTISIIEIENANIEFFPNPSSAQGSILVSDGSTGTPILFTLYDTQGKLIGSKRIQSGDLISLDQWKLSHGGYIVTMQNNQRIVRSKLIVSGKK